MVIGTNVHSHSTPNIISHPSILMVNRWVFVDQWLSLMSTQVAPGAIPILHGHFDLTTHLILSQGSSIWILLIEMLPLIFTVLELFDFKVGNPH